jgi:RimJ/RimL family protein N-acetyltransferase
LIIRSATTDDAAQLTTLMQQVDQSSQYMLWEAGERNIPAENQLKMIDGIQRKDNSTILVAEAGEELIGYMFILGGNARRQRHTAYIVVGILEAHRGKGIGTRLFSEMNEWASNNNIHRLELTVVIDNKAGVALYKKMGFEIEGIKKDSLLINDKFYDEYYMAKIL